MNTLKKARVKKSMAWKAELMDLVYLEHTNVTIWTHKDSLCAGQQCTIHNLSDHRMRSFPQEWRGDRGIMERTCPHGVGHPDPDDYKCNRDKWERVHGCDGCCMEVNTINPDFNE